MRILIADQNALLLAAIAGTFGRHCEIVTATRRDACIEHLERERFDVVVACEKLRDYTGLELLSEIESVSPHTLRIFSAPAPRLARLQSRLDHFRLFGTLSYPIEARKLLVALKVARTKLPARPKVHHVVLESEWDTGERLGLLEQELEVAPADPPVLAEAAPHPATETPDDIPVIESTDDASVSLVRRVREIPAAEVSFEVSFDENPSRFDATAAATQAHGRAGQTRPGAGAEAGIGGPARNSQTRGRASTASGNEARPQGSVTASARTRPNTPAGASEQIHPYVPVAPIAQTRSRTSADSSGQTQSRPSAPSRDQARSHALAAPSGGQGQSHASTGVSGQTRSRSSAAPSGNQAQPHASAGPSGQTRSRSPAATSGQPRSHTPVAPSGNQAQPHASAGPSGQTRSRSSAASSDQARSHAPATPRGGQAQPHASAGSSGQTRSHVPAPQAPSKQSPPFLPPSSPGKLLFPDEQYTDETVDVAFDVLPQDFTATAAPANDPSVEEPPPPPPPPPPVDTGGAANDAKFDTGGPGPADKTSAKPTQASARTAAAKTQQAPTAKTPPAKTAPSGPRPRKPAMPTRAQREAFQRAVERRDAARNARGRATNNNRGSGNSSDARGHLGGAQDPIAALSATGSFKPHWHGTHSLSDLAGMAATRRPLKSMHNSQPNRKVFVVGSGIAAVLLASVLAFELTGSNAPTHHSRRAAAAQLFSPRSDLVAQNSGEPAPIFSPTPPPQSERTGSPTPPATALPQPQVFDPDTAPPDPPPPPALEHPGPMEPPSMAHNEPPVGMQGPDF